MLKSSYGKAQQFGKTNGYGCKEYHVVAEPNLAHRPGMEDEALVQDNFFNSQNRAVLFAVMDGHGGPLVSRILKDRLVEEFRAALKSHPKDLGALLGAGFAAVSETVDRQKVEACGSTLTVGLICLEEAKKILIVANVGDSSAYLFDDKTCEKMTLDHRATESSEVERVKKLGGKIINSRLGGVLSVTRAMGDLELREMGLVSKPSIRRVELRLSHRWVVVASDGLWDYVQLEEVRRVLRAEDEARAASGALVRLALSKGSMDNVTVLVIKV